MTASARRPGRPRDPARDQAIRNAAVDLLAEHGYAAVTVDAVAARAGVAKTTLYRRWPSKRDLVLDAVASRMAVPPPPTGDLAADLRAVTVAFYRQLAEPVAGRSLLAVAVELLDEPELAEAYRERFVRPLRRRARELLEQARDAGLVRAGVDLELVLDLVAAPALYRPVALGRPAGAECGEQVYDLVMAAVSEPSDARPVTDRQDEPDPR